MSWTYFTTSIGKIPILVEEGDPGISFRKKVTFGIEEGKQRAQIQPHVSPI